MISQEALQEGHITGMTAASANQHLATAADEPITAVGHIRPLAIQRHYSYWFSEKWAGTFLLFPRQGVGGETYPIIAIIILVILLAPFIEMLAPTSFYTDVICV